MKIILTRKEIEDILFSALCNSAHIHYGAMKIECNKDEYSQAKKLLLTPTIESVWMKMLENGCRLTVVDNEDNSKHSFSMINAYEAISSLPNQILLDFVNGDDDGETADYVLEYIMYGIKMYA